VVFVLAGLFAEVLDAADALVGLQSILLTICVGGWSTLIGIGLLRIIHSENPVGDERWALLAWLLLIVGIVSYIGLLLWGTVMLIQFIPNVGDQFCTRFESICEATMPLWQVTRF